jgi:hypothetical protein
LVCTETLQGRSSAVSYGLNQKVNTQSKKASRKDTKDAQRRKEISIVGNSLRLCEKLSGFA